MTHIPSTGALLLTALLAPAWAQAPSPTPPAAQAVARQDKERLLERLYRWVWPLGRFQGNLPETVSRMTERSEAGGLPRLYLLDTATAVLSEWPGARGAQDPVLCTGPATLYYRRGATVVRQALRTDAGGTPTPGPPRRLEGPPVQALLACLPGESLGPGLVARAADGRPGVMRVGDSVAVWEPLPAELALDADTTLTALRRLRALRPDGLVLAVRDGQLVREAAGQVSMPVPGADGVRFVGAPVWLPDGRFAIVPAMAGEE